MKFLVVVAPPSIYQKVLKCIRVMENVDIILLRPDNLSPEIAEFIIVVTMVEVDIGLKITATLSIVVAEFIILVLMLEEELCVKRLATLTFAIVKKKLMLTGEVDMGIRPATLSPITQVDLIYC